MYIQASFVCVGLYVWRWACIGGRRPWYEINPALSSFAPGHVSSGRQNDRSATDSACLRCCGIQVIMSLSNDLNSIKKGCRYKTACIIYKRHNAIRVALLLSLCLCLWWLWSVDGFQHPWGAGKVRFRTLPRNFKNPSKLFVRLQPK